MINDKYPTLHELGLGPQLDALERLAVKGRETHPADDWLKRGEEEHLEHAYDHADAAFWYLEKKDRATGEHNSLHCALRSLMAAACAEASK